MDPECAIYESLQVYTRNAKNSDSHIHDFFQNHAENWKSS